MISSRSMNVSVAEGGKALTAVASLDRTPANPLVWSMIAKILLQVFLIAGFAGAAELRLVRKGDDPFAQGCDLKIDFETGVMLFKQGSAGTGRKETLKHAGMIHDHVKRLLAGMKDESVEAVTESEPQYMLSYSDGKTKTERLIGTSHVPGNFLPQGSVLEAQSLEARLANGEHLKAHLNSVLLARLLHDVMDAYFLEQEDGAGLEYPAYFSEPGMAKVPFDFVGESYVAHLKALEEKSLPPRAKDRAQHLYRWTCMRTFHEGFCITLEIRPDGSGHLVYKMESGKGGYEPGALKTSGEMSVPKADVADFLDRVNSTKFWTQVRNDPDMGGLDGSRWIIEGVKDSRYHVVERWTPRDGTFAHELGTRLLKMAWWTIENLY